MGAVERSRHRHAAVAVLAAALLLGACGDDGVDERPASEPPGFTAAAGREVVLGLCAALEDVGADPARAERAFVDRAHGGLHALAAAAEGADRAAAARLLEAKRRVEAGFEDGGPGLAELEELLAATRDALAAVGLPSPPCP